MSVASLTIGKGSRGDYHLTLVRPTSRFPDEGVLKLSTRQGETLRKYILDAALGSTTGTQRLESLRNLGRLLYDLLPKKIKRALSQLENPLIIVSPDPSIPWELLHDENEFLGLREVIGRALPELLPPDEPMPPPEKLSALIISNPTGELKYADEEAQELHQLLRENRVAVNLMRGSRANWIEVKECLGSGQYNLIHYTGHAKYVQDEGMGYLELSDGDFPAELIVAELEGSPLVIVNGCESAYQSYERPNAFQFDAAISSLPEAFLAKGARGFIGASWPISDQGACTFSRFLYKALLSDKSTLGEAMRYARMQSREAMKNDAAWAAYVSYGHPLDRLVVVEGAPVPKRPPHKKKDEPFIDLEKGINTRRLSKQALLALFYAWNERRRLGHTYLETVHLVIGLTKVPGGYTQRALLRQGKDPKLVRSELRRYFRDKQVADEPTGKSAELTTTKRLRQILRYAENEAKDEGTPKIEEKHLLNSFVREEDSDILGILHEDLGVDLDELVHDAPHPLFPNGQLDETLLDINSREIIHAAKKLAEGLETDFLNTAVFFQALQERDNSLINAGLRDQECSPENLSRVFQRIYQLGQKSTSRHRKEIVS